MAIAADTNIYLIGPRASGKTTLGRMMAEALGRSFVDLDEVFRTRRGESIAALVEREGWDAFRTVESEILREESRVPGRVLATGGGAVLAPENRAVLGGGVCVYLRAEPEELARRLLAEAKPEQRPSLSELDFEQEIRTTLREREPLYLSCAQVVLPPREVGELLQQALVALAMV